MRTRLMLALIAALFVAVLAPTFAGGVRMGNWTQICTASGMAWVQVGDGAPAGDTGHAQGSHCPWCGMQPLALLPSPPPSVQLNPRLQHALPLTYWQAPRRLHAWTAAQPRGPPAA